MFKKNKKYKNPNKYLIKNNVFLRDFKKLYSRIKDPWNQKKNFDIDESILILEGFINAINLKYKKANILDIGAGSDILKKKFKKKSFSYLGTDIHKKKFKNIVYDDIKILNKNFINKFDIIFCLKTIYYVSDKIDKVIKNFKKYLKPNGFLIISYNIKKKSFSNKFLTDLKLRKILKKYFKEIYTIELNRELYKKNRDMEKVTIFIFQQRQRTRFHLSS